MDFSLSTSQKEIQKAAWEFAKGEFDKERIMEWSAAQEFPAGLLKKAGDLGFSGVHYPESIGGGGMGLLEYVLVAETFCRKDSTLGAALMSSGFGAECILRFGDEALKTAFLPGVAAGEIRASVAFFEGCRGDDIRRVDATAVKEGDNWIVSGRKTLAPVPGPAGFYVVLCRTKDDAPPGEGLSLFVVEADRPGVHIGQSPRKLGWQLTALADVAFDQVRVPASHRIGAQDQGYRQAQAFFTENRIQIAGMAVGSAQGAFDRACAYVRQREQFGKKLADFQITRHKLAEMAAIIEAARLLTYQAAWGFDNHGQDPKPAAIAKMTAARAALKVADTAVQLLGGYGYMTEYEVEHFYRDAKQAELVQGTPGRLRDVISESLLGDLRQGRK